MSKEHESIADITTAEVNEIIQLYAEAEANLNGLNDLDEVESKCNHIVGYYLIIDDFDEANPEYVDMFTIQVVTDNREPNTLQGIRVYFDRKEKKLSRFIDVFFNDEEYPFEDYEVKTED